MTNSSQRPVPIHARDRIRRLKLEFAGEEAMGTQIAKKHSLTVAVQTGTSIHKNLQHGAR